MKSSNILFFPNRNQSILSKIDIIIKKLFQLRTFFTNSFPILVNFRECFLDTETFLIGRIYLIKFQLFKNLLKGKYYTYFLKIYYTKIYPLSGITFPFFYPFLPSFLLLFSFFHFFFLCLFLKHYASLLILMVLKHFILRTLSTKKSLRTSENFCSCDFYLNIYKT